MKSSARWLLGLAVVGLAFGGYQSYQARQTIAPMSAQQQLRTAPDFDLPIYQGGRNIRLSALKGQVVLVNFYETICPHCQHEMGAFNRVYRELKPKGLEIVGISLDQSGLLDGARQVSAIAREHRVLFPLVIGNDEVAERYGGIDAVPMSFLVNREGRVVRTFRGAVDDKTLKEAIAPLL